MVSSEFEALRTQLRGTPFPSGLAELRQAVDGMGTQFLPGAPKVASREATLGGRPCLWFNQDAATTNGVVLYFHGGGYSVGSIASHSHMGPGIAANSGAAVVILGYRLAPEHLFPAAIDDAFAAYQELKKSFGAGRIALAGDSAGGGLAMALIAKVAAEGGTQPACAYCMSPWVDLAVESETMKTKAAADPITGPARLNEMASWYAGAAKLKDPYVSPLYADLRQAPPTYIQVGTAEVLLGESLRLAEILALADRQVHLDVWPEMFHTWQTFYTVIPEGKAALIDGCNFIKRHLKAPTKG